MILEDVFKLIDQLTPEEKRQVSAYIERAQQAALRQQIDAILESAPPPNLVAGTMDIDRLMDAVQGMWAGLDEDEIGAIVQAMNEEYIDSDDESDA